MEPVIPILTSANLLLYYATGRSQELTTQSLVAHCSAQAWSESAGLPDHALNSMRDYALGRTGEVGTMLLRSLEWLTKHTLIWRGNRIEVDESAFERWQQIITQISPLALLSWKIADKVRNLPPSAEREYIQENISEQVFPCFHDPLMEARIREEGLSDLHVHMNGSTPSDTIWLDALAHPRRFRYGMSLEQRKNREDVEALFLQYSPFFDWKGCCNLVDIASRLRDWLVRYLYSQKNCPVASANPVPEDCHRACQPQSPSDKSSPRLCPQFRWQRHLWKDANLSRYVIFDHVQAPYYDGHPLRAYFPSEGSRCNSPLQWEAQFLVRLFLALQDKKNERVSRFTHYYLLIQSLFTRVLVQQVSQNGFDQFQKITQTGIREPSETHYTDRFYQFASATSGVETYIEGRFAPKSSTNKLISLLRSIDDGYHNFQHNRRGKEQPLEWNWEQRDKDSFARFAGPPPQQPATVHNARHQQSALELALVAHFIKKHDSRTYYGCQHYSLRRQLDKQTRHLLNAMRVAPGCHLIVGADAAANELHTPPEVFAPVFRQLRMAGHTNFTFHAGEDFRHLVSGIRAVDEAVRFLELSAGCRIGHATALGIDPDLWKQRTGRPILLPKTEWLDNLVYAHHQLTHENMAEEADKAADHISRLSEEIYGTPHSPQTLWAAWQLRYLDPICCFVDRYRQTSFLQHDVERDLIRQERNGRSSNSAFALFSHYHGKDVFQRYNVRAMPKDALSNFYEEVSPDFFSNNALHYLQDAVLRQLEKKKIAIESLLTSNVRISFYQNYSEHHILRWLNLPEKSPPPPMPIICLGSDDPGIFATTIKNEYYHLLKIVQKHTSNGNAVDVVGSVLKQSKAYRFKTN